MTLTVTNPSMDQEREVEIVLRGELLSRSNPIIVPREWIESVGQVGA